MTHIHRKKAGIYLLGFEEFPRWVYIGQTKDFSSRKNTHKKFLRKGKHPNPLIQKLYNDGYTLTFLFIKPIDVFEERVAYEQKMIQRMSRNYTIMNEPYCHAVTF